ncbi:NAD(P)-dependent oxidoreductase [Roseibacillus persicicus]|uniref:NAD(P)-dependent oxidoreductase n=1 Tax=Roseibacillus persicicus TaxID=454148 RepID=UPI00280EF20F|nr:NAD(P)-dependent oxidoreductase [Roseibacillus persicicus]MDQ8191629.1 NAD(P)-dependent oxidoreductase [Roseibacillus persicicus]
MSDRKAVAPGKTRLGWIGTGVMGRSMARHLMEAGFELSVFSRTREKAAELLEMDAEWVDSPAEVARRSEVIFTMVGFPSDVREVILGEDGVLSGAKAGLVIVDMTTSEPTLAKEIFERAREKEVASLDAPVSGGDVGAQNGTLSIMIGGEKTVVEALQPCWDAMGKTIVHQGEPGAGQHTKMVNQTLVAAGMVGVCEALLYASRAGLDLETVLQSVSSGAAGSWALSNLGPRIIAHNFEPGFYVEHFIKDMGIALAEAERMEIKLPGLQLASELYRKLQEMGHGRKGTQALQLALAEMSGVDWTEDGDRD